MSHSNKKAKWKVVGQPKNGPVQQSLKQSTQAQTKAPVQTKVQEVKPPVKPEVTPEVKKPQPQKRVVKIEAAFPKSVVYGQPFAFAPGYATATGEGGDLRFDPPFGTPGVGPANVRVLAPGNGGQWLDGDASTSVTVAPAPRTIQSAAPAKPVLLGSDLTPEMFGAVPSAGTGTVAIAEPANKKVATFPKQRVVLKLDAAGNHAAAPPVPYDIDVELPERPFVWNQPGPVVYGTALTPAVLGVAEKDAVLTAPASATPDAGTVDVTITLPGDNATCRDAVRTHTVTIQPAPRTIKHTPPKVAFKTGDILTADSFKALGDPCKTKPAVTVPANGLLLKPGKAIDVTLSLPLGNYQKVDKPLTIQVEKGEPKITWTPSLVAIKGTSVNATLNAAIAPVALQPRLAYAPPAGSMFDVRDVQYLTAYFAGDADFVATKKVVKVALVDNASQQQGANDMLNGVAWTQPTAGAKKDSLDRWNADEKKVATLGKKIVADLSSMGYDAIVEYMKNLDLSKLGPKPPVTVAKKPGEDMWSFSNGLQVRVKASGDKHTNACAVDVECVDAPGTFTTHVNQTSFKIMSNGEPGAWGPFDNQVNDPGGLTNQQWQDYKDGTARATHLICPKIAPVIKWTLADPATPKNLTRNEAHPDLMSPVCVGGAFKFFLDRQEVTQEAFAAFKFPRADKYRLRVEGVADGRHSQTVVSVEVTAA